MLRTHPTVKRIWGELDERAGRCRLLSDPLANRAEGEMRAPGSSAVSKIAVKYTVETKGWLENIARRTV
jgi:hypothetical protein